MPQDSQAHHSKRGVVAPLVIIMLAMLVGFSTLTIDVGHMYVATAEMQQAMDSSAMAGASAVEKGNTEIISRALDYASRNHVYTLPVDASEVTIEIGYWEGTTKTFSLPTGVELTLPNAVRSYGVRQNLPLFFANVMGISDARIQKDAIAAGGSGQCAGVWGLQGVRGTGSLKTDSYNSQEGVYGAGNIYANGDVCSNQDIDIGGSVDIYGDAMNGEGYDFITHGNSYKVYGAVDQHCCSVTPPTIDMADAISFNNNNSIGLTDEGNSPFQGAPSAYRLFLTSTDNLTLNAGRYYFSSVRMAGQATLTVNGQVEIYVSGTADFSGGGIVNPSVDPHDLIIYSTGTTMKLTGGAGFYGAIVAPDAAVTLIGTSDLYGTIMADTLTMPGDTSIHVDESLVEQVFSMTSIHPALVE